MIDPGVCSSQGGLSPGLAQYPPCRSLEEITEYSEEMKDYSFVRLTRETGCYVKEYRFNKVKYGF